MLALNLDYFFPLPFKFDLKERCLMCNEVICDKQEFVVIVDVATLIHRRIRAMAISLE